MTRKQKALREIRVFAQDVANYARHSFATGKDHYHPMDCLLAKINARMLIVREETQAERAQS